MHMSEYACSFESFSDKEKGPFFGTEEDTSMNSRCSDSIISHKHYLKVSLENALEIKLWLKKRTRIIL
jgi:hypothetical protein